MVAARPYGGARRGYTRANYADWVRGFRARWSDRTSVIRPQTYRLLFKKAIGMREPQFFAPTCSSQEVKEEIITKEEGKATEETHVEIP